MYTLKKDKHIILKIGICITAKFLTLLASGKNSRLEASLNNYNLTTYVAEAFGMKILTDT